MTNNPLMEVALLQGHAPYTLAGYEKFRSVIDSDGALPAKFKALFAAAAAIDRRHLALARREFRPDCIGKPARRGRRHRFRVDHR